MRALALLVLAGAVAVPATAGAEELGRLFFTPAERKELDTARERYDPTRQEIIVKHGPAAVAEEPEPLPDLAVDGLVIRSSGRNATWINGAGMLSGESTEEGIRVEADRRAGSVRFVLPGGGDSAPIKPGQLLDPNAGKVRERYNIKPPADDG